MNYLHTHGIALIGLAILVWASIKSLEMFATIEPRAEQGDRALKGLVELVTQRRRTVGQP
jgi:hypothetical protein